MNALTRLLTEAKPGPWRWDPGQEDDFEVPPVMWFTNADGDSLLVEVEDVAALLSLALGVGALVWLAPEEDMARYRREQAKLRDMLR